MHMTSRTLCLALLLATFVLAGPAAASTSHKGWPTINGMLLTNKTDSDRPLDARPGREPFAGKDSAYSCDAVHKRGKCQQFFVTCSSSACKPGTVVVADKRVHNELLGGHGSDTIHAGDHGDVVWGDHKGKGQPRRQRDRLYGGDGKDFLYASHGWNTIKAGAGPDYVKAHFGRGIIDCGPGRDRLFISHKVQRHYKIRHCERISHRSLGY